MAGLRMPDTPPAAPGDPAAAGDITAGDAFAAAAGDPPASPGGLSTFKDLEGLSRDFSASLLFDDNTGDIVLIVQDERLHAHRAILASRSPVFKAMFFGGMLESSAREVEVNAFAPATMRLLLRFIYAGALNDVRLEDMVPLMACADHYGVHALRDTICTHLCDTICPETACTVLALARAYRTEAVQERYLNFILTHAQQVTETDSFLKLDEDVLTTVLEADEARIEEIDLFKALVRWHTHWSHEPEASPDEKQSERLFGSIRYGVMSGPQLVTEVKPFSGNVVPRNLYVRALEKVAAPDVTSYEETYRKQATRRQPPIGMIRTSAPHDIAVHSTTVRKLAGVGWNCTASIEPSTSRTCFRVERLADETNGLGVAVYDPRRVSSGVFPNPNQWGADCLVGIYGTGCFFPIITDHVLRWRVGLVVEVVLRTIPCETGTGETGTLHVTFTAEGREDDGISEPLPPKCVTVEGHLAVALPTYVRLALALYSPEDRVSVEYNW